MSVKIQIAGMELFLTEALGVLGFFISLLGLSLSICNTLFDVKGWIKFHFYKSDFEAGYVRSINGPKYTNGITFNITNKGDKAALLKSFMIFKKPKFSITTIFKSSKMTHSDFLVPTTTTFSAEGIFGQTKIDPKSSEIIRCENAKTLAADIDKAKETHNVYMRLTFSDKSKAIDCKL